ncbi:nucleotide-diphospho-sugar transferase [Lipomyces japonicus]|uniref:nucleotide-diphospho-sugar transferase n=1 Tax=Lipomyces japonicus TaxID=56871 RepID=UPI0034CF5F83
MSTGQVIISVIGCVFAAWYCFIFLIVCIGYYQLRTKFSSSAAPSKSSRRSDALGVSILRPLKGIDTQFEACISSSFQQSYPNYEIIFCVDDANDPAIPIVRKIMARYPSVSCQLLVGSIRYGVNPKVNNLIRAYDLAKHDIVWVLDSNCWVTSGALGRAVDAFEADARVQLVHHLPVCVDISDNAWGSRLDEMFMSTSHAKFYVAINTVAVASCVMGKSNFYRRSRLNQAEPLGIKGFAKFIAEDHLIGDSLWKQGGRHFMTCDAAIQPVNKASFSDYCFRRMRWLRVRKYMVTAATVVEPMTECFVCSAMGATAFTILFSRLASWLLVFFVSVCAWAACDFWIFANLHEHRNVESFLDASTTPYFVKPRAWSLRDMPKWLTSWLLREALALPIWIKAMSGSKLEWRKKLFYIKPDMTAVEIQRQPDESLRT